MSKYIGKFFLTLIPSLILTFLLSLYFVDVDGERSVAWILTFGIVIILMLSFLITLIYHLIDLIKHKS